MGTTDLENRKSKSYYETVQRVKERRPNSQGKLVQRRKHLFVKLENRN